MGDRTVLMLPIGLDGRYVVLRLPPFLDSVHSPRRVTVPRVRPSGSHYDAL